LEAYRRVHELDIPAKAAESDTDVELEERKFESQFRSHCQEAIAPLK
jgi:hypothetical protein